MFLMKQFHSPMHLVPGRHLLRLSGFTPVSAGCSGGGFTAASPEVFRGGEPVGRGGNHGNGLLITADGSN